MIGHFRSFRTRGVYANVASFRREVFSTLQKKFGPVLRREGEATTQGWVKTPIWKEEYRIEEQGITVALVPTGPYAENWRRIDRGVPGRVQRVRRTSTYRGVGNYKPSMRFRKYSPRTTARGGTGGPGRYYGRFIFAKGPYWWPGIAPRNFTPRIQKNTLQPFRKVAELGARRGVRAAQKEGK